MPVPELMQRLATIYAGEAIRYPKLKAVTLAQWLLESARGTSDLATLHYNFGGLKWRPEMAMYATRIMYQAHDGLDAYCKFATLENYVRGYWAFIDRAPYSGWEMHTTSAADYIGFIGPIYTPSADYPGKVLGLVAEAQALLDKGGASNGGVITAGAKKLGTLILDPGHGGSGPLGGSSANNATSKSGVKEKKLTLDFCLILRDQIRQQAAANGEAIEVILTRDKDVNVGIKDRAGFAATHKARGLICIHFNGSNDAAISGAETYYRSAANGNSNEAEDKAFAGAVHDGLIKGLKKVNPATKDRKLKPDTASGPGSLGILRDDYLGNANRTKKCLGAYIELEFISNPAVEKVLISGPDAIPNRVAAMAELAKAIREHLAKIQ